LGGSHFNVWRFLNPALAGRNQLWLVSVWSARFCGISRCFVQPCQKVYQKQKTPPMLWRGLFIRIMLY
jgi:hypothetical protein